ncbi:MAG: uracil-DNA glycosylase [Candidatus Paraimprobicoccus trichonymphae]|uniref:Type-4 uracil-DNA glycosylase n=1 Tax=Candidatus Paraimprobicoccus trichonymphae TaxID=3033793 RepID=A0AA48L181_9FIRM|nr:MAG: uracil-DNA glycosylase [Candidatus Paraimprobicoccus trichonymphae]
MYISWEELKINCLKCLKCDLSKTRSNVVFGEGNEKSKIFFIGEGPGEQEDLKAKPFVGRSGKLLDKMLENINLSRKKNIYIANIVKCRPPENRDPKENEQHACLDWLRNQVLIIKPKIIVTLGRIASTCLIKPDFKITKEHGKFFKKNNFIIMPTFHPAAILRDPNKKILTEQDFMKLRNIMDKIQFE